MHADSQNIFMAAKPQNKLFCWRTAMHPEDTKILYMNVACNNLTVEEEIICQERT